MSDNMCLSEEFKIVTEELNDLYQHKHFLEERIQVLELKLKELGELIDFADSLDESLINGG